MVLAGPVGTPGMPPTVMRTMKWVKDAISFILIIIRSLEMKAAVEGDIPRVAIATGDDLQVFPHVIANQHTSLAAPVIGRIMKGMAVGYRRERASRRNIGRTLRCPYSPQIAKCLGRHSSRTRQPLGVSLGHIESAIRPPSQTMQTMFKVSQVRIDQHVLVSNIVSVPVPNHGKIRCIGYPQIGTMPCQSLDIVKTSSKCLASLKDTIAVLVEQQHNTVARGVGGWAPILWPHAHKQSSSAIKHQGTGVPNERFSGNELNRESLGHDGKRVEVTRFLILS